jgi:hypothetical protein
MLLCMDSHDREHNRCHAPTLKSFGGSRVMHSFDRQSLQRSRRKMKILFADRKFLKLIDRGSTKLSSTLAQFAGVDALC